MKLERGNSSGSRGAGWRGVLLRFAAPRQWRGVGRLWRRTEGTSQVEFALSSTLIMGLLFGTIQVCLALYDYSSLADAARRGTRYAMVRGSTSCSNTPNLTNCNATAAEIQSYVQGIDYPGIPGSKLVVNTSWYGASSSTPRTWSLCTGACNSPGNEVRVSVNYPLGSVTIPFVKTISLSLNSTSEMMIAQ